MNVFLFEYATCGAFPELNPSITVEGLGMFKALASGFDDLTTFVDKRIPLEGYPKVESYREMFLECLEKADAALLITPETGMEYYNFVVELERTGCTNLGSNSGAVKDTTDKYETYKKLKGLCTPKTKIFEGNTNEVFPLVAKPRDGVSCEGVHLVEHDADLEKVPRGYLLQEYISGKPYSASLLVGDETEILSINTQEIESFEYQGAIIPAPLKLSSDDEEDLIKAVECFKGLKGYVGMDFVYEDGVVIIEVNARPTIPIIALEEVYGCKIAELILKNHFNESIPEYKPKKRVRIRKHSASSSMKGINPFVEFKGYSISLTSEGSGGFP